MLGVGVDLSCDEKEERADRISLPNDRLAALETAGPLREQLVRQELDCCCKQMSSGLSSLTATVASITKLVIPNGAICPGWGAAEVTVKPATAAA